MPNDEGRVLPSPVGSTRRQAPPSASVNVEEQPGFGFLKSMSSGLALVGLICVAAGAILGFLLMGRDTALGVAVMIVLISQGLGMIVFGQLIVLALTAESHLRRLADKLAP